MTQQSDERVRKQVADVTAKQDGLESRMGADGKCKDAFEITPVAWMCYYRSGKCPFEYFNGSIKFCKRYVKHE